MSDFIIYNPNDSLVSGRVTAYLKSVNDPDYSAEPYKLCMPDTSEVSSVIQAYWKVSGEQVIEMTADEKEIIDAELKLGAYARKSKREICDSIYNAITTQEQADRVEAALASMPFFSEHLDSENYSMAHIWVIRALQAGKITQDDHDLIRSLIPLP
jgi:hypothetical protein